MISPRAKPHCTNLLVEGKVLDINLTKATQYDGHEPGARSIFVQNHFLCETLGEMATSALKQDIVK